MAPGVRLINLETAVTRQADFAPGKAVPMRAQKMRLRHASTADGKWLATTLSRVSRAFGSRVEHQPDGTLLLRDCTACLNGPEAALEQRQAEEGGKRRDT